METVIINPDKHTQTSKSFDLCIFLPKCIVLGQMFTHPSEAQQITGTPLSALKERKITITLESWKKGKIPAAKLLQQKG